ncbi:uncharacterized protein LOC128264856 [Drosophila gunungcola]|uniref:uncharacterized protein LOC128264856 n=1 Tax=Drosophila gunungcola TaxID=103775 RepID=UPI0022E6CB1B|nr:uncharacterized protein LOC128264856 [Drosophila gunungcola]
MIIWTMMMMMVMPQTFRGINTNGKISDPRSQILMPTSLNSSSWQTPRSSPVQRLAVTIVRGRPTLNSKPIKTSKQATRVTICQPANNNRCNSNNKCNKTQINNGPTTYTHGQAKRSPERIGGPENQKLGTWNVELGTYKTTTTTIGREKHSKNTKTTTTRGRPGQGIRTRTNPKTTTTTAT